MNAGDMQGIEPCTIHRLLAYQPRKSGDGGLADLDAATEEARLGSQGAFQYNRWGCAPGGVSVWGGRGGRGWQQAADQQSGR